MSGKGTTAKVGDAVVAKKVPWWFGLQTHWIYLVVIVVFVAAGAGLIIYEHNRNMAPSAPKVTANDLNTIFNEANAASYNNDTQEALNIYSQNIPNAANKDVAGQLNLGAALAAQSENKLQLALSYALVAEADQPSASISALIASIYQQMGNKNQAVNYYKKAASQVPPHVVAGNTSAYYLQEAQQVGGGSK